MLEEAEGEAALLEPGEAWGCLLWDSDRIPVVAFNSDLFARPWFSDQDLGTLHLVQCLQDLGTLH